MLRITVKDERELRDLARDLKRAKGTLRREVSTSLKRSGQETLRKVKRNVETITMTGYRRRRAKSRFPANAGGRGGIRKRVSRVTELDVSTSSAAPRIRFVVRSDRLGNAKNMPRLLDSGRKFRHPLLGNRNAWVDQKGEPWFRQTILRDLKLIRKDVDGALDRVGRTIERG